MFSKGRLRQKVNEEIEKVQDIMKFYGIPCWIMYCDEKSDPYFARIVTSKTVVPAAALISQTECFLIVHDLDACNVLEHKNVKMISYEREEDLWKEIENALSRLDLPEEIALSYSTIQDAQVDVMGFGLYSFLKELMTTFYSRKDRKVKFSSAERLIYAHFDRKNEIAISRMRLAATRALEILESAFENIRPGMSELDVVKLVHSLVAQKPSYFTKSGVIDEELAWDEHMCPVVLAGPSLQKGGHTSASKLVLERGHTVYFDFGVTLTFEDGSRWSSDIQRMGYILREGETRPPLEVLKVFETLVESIMIGMKAIRPGMKGYEIDQLVRAHIVNAGYPDYNHATGHAIGELAHNPGALLGPKDRKLSHLEIQPNGVYTIEPRVPISNGGSIEEMVLVTPDGGTPLCSQQKALYLIKQRDWED